MADAYRSSGVQRCVSDIGIAEIVSGAAHDPRWISRVAPTAMIFCRCVDGVSHNEEERIEMTWVTAGANVLLHLKKLN